MKPSEKISDKNRFYLQLLAPILQDDDNVAGVKVVLRAARKHGLNPEKLYELATKNKPLAPSTDDVFPL